MFHHRLAFRDLKNTERSRISSRVQYRVAWRGINLDVVEVMSRGSLHVVINEPQEGFVPFGDVESVAALLSETYRSGPKVRDIRLYVLEQQGQRRMLCPQCRWDAARASFTQRPDRRRVPADVLGVVDEGDSLLSA